MARLVLVGAATINNNADNRVITGDDSPGVLNAETNLTFDGSKLDVRGDTIIAADTPVNPIGVTGLEVYNNAGQARLMIHQDDGTSDSKLSFRTGGNDTSISVPASTNGLVFDFENQSGGFAFDTSGRITTPITASSNISASGFFSGSTLNLFTADNQVAVFESY